GPRDPRVHVLRSDPTPEPAAVATPAVGTGHASGISFSAFRHRFREREGAAVAESDRRQTARVRAARNQQPARRLNDAISKLRYSSAFNEYVCECGMKTCLEVIVLTIDEYQEIRSEPDHLIVLPGHWTSTTERLVREEPGYHVVERIDGVSV